VTIATYVGVEASMARNDGWQQNHVNAPAQMISEFWKFTIPQPLALEA